MASRYYFLLPGFFIFLLFALWDHRLKSTLTEISQLPCTQQANISSAALAQNNSSVPKPRILCWVPTGPTFHMTKSVHVKRTWGSRCDKLIFMSSVEDPRLGTVALEGVKEGHSKLWPKTQKAFQYVWEHHKNDADWFLKADDDTYVFMDNLRRLLKDHDPTEPHYFGAMTSFFTGVQPINFGGTGYVLSREAVRRFVEVALVKGGECFTGTRRDYKGDEDTEIGLCLRSIGVTPEWTKDEQGRERFWMDTPMRKFEDLPENYERRWNDGPADVSNRAISFHAVSPYELYVLDYLTHFLKTNY